MISKKFKKFLNKNQNEIFVFKLIEKNSIDDSLSYIYIYFLILLKNKIYF